MSARTKVPFFDQGLFLLHLNRGKEELRRGEYSLARHELEDALQLRPHDPEVLSNLSFTLFHLGHFDDAERMTRELLTTHAGSVPLLFNLGLILYKSGREAEAVEPLRGVLTLAPTHRKAHLTLGMVLQKMGVTDEARQHFRAAGADRKAGYDGDDTLARAARKAATLEDDEERANISTSPIVKPDRVEALEGGDEVLRVEPEQEPPLSAPLRPPPAAAGAFQTRSGGFVSGDTASGIYVRRGALTGRTGSPLLAADRQLSGSLAQVLIRATGDGAVLLVSRGRHPHLLSLSEEFLSVEPNRLLGFEASLMFREDPAFEFRRHISAPFLKLFGRGAVALAVTSEPARFEVAAGQPLTIAARTVVAYGGDLSPDLLEETDPLAELGAGPVFRFVGEGYVLADAG